MAGIITAVCVMLYDVLVFWQRVSYNNNSSHTRFRALLIRSAEVSGMVYTQKANRILA